MTRLGHGLTGDVRWSSDCPEHADTFVRELAELMERHKIDKIDVCWSRYTLEKMKEEKQ